MLPNQMALTNDKLYPNSAYLSSTEHKVESQVRDYFVLLKPRVMSLVVFTGAAGLFLAPGSIHPLIALVTILCIALGSGAAGAINMWYDRDIDMIMERTKNRPIPRGIIHPDDALQFGILLAAFSILIMAIAVNLLSAFLLTIAILFYVLVYTMYLKRRTVQNIVIGGAAGAIPPMIGWAAVTSNVSVESFILFMIIFFWTPPHFWSLALYKADDYKKAKVPMLPVTHGELITKRQIIIYTVILSIASLLPAIWFTHFTYLIVAILLNILFLYYVVMSYSDNSYYYAKKTFGFSILYLFMIFFTMIIEGVYYQY
ncbi:Protoheme IX farnesyltransferase [Rickettsiales bacterium Ac37b]|nr:Protoheme IX farnesyltransferase [Rickettsiales bacterium Ac37b]